MPKTTPPSQLVLFDLDDTLFDHSLTCRAALAEVRSEHPRFRLRSLDELLEEYLRLLDAHVTVLSSTPAVYSHRRAERFRTLARGCGWVISASHAEEISRGYRAAYQRLRRPVPGAPGFVRRVASRARVGVVTNNERNEQEEKLRFLGLADVVDLLVVSAEERVAKPDPRIFRIALARAGARPAEAVMIGDSWRNDVLGARAAGIRPVWFNRFGLPRPSRHAAEEVRSFRPFGPAETVVHRRAPSSRKKRK